MKDYLTIGQIINTHGVKGEIKVYSLGDDVRRFRKLKTVFIDDEEKNVVWCKLQGDKMAILKIEGVDTIEAANKLRNKYIEVPREDAVKLPEGRYFVADIVGCKVIDENGNELGNVYDVIFTGSNDVYWVKGKVEVLVPVIKDIIVNIDTENKVITIKPLEVWQ